MKTCKKKALKKRSGMTLIEITIAVVIIGIVSSYAFAQAAAYSDKAKYSRAVEDMAAITTALSISYLEHCDIWQPREGTGRTGSADGLDPIFTGENITEHIGRRLSKRAENIRDPWGNPYIVEMMEDGDTMTAIVCCMNDDYDFSLDTAEESNGNNGNNGNGPVRTTAIIMAGKTEMAETITEMETAQERTAATITGTGMETGTGATEIMKVEAGVTESG